MRARQHKTKITDTIGINDGHHSRLQAPPPTCVLGSYIQVADADAAQRQRRQPEPDGDERRGGGGGSTDRGGDGQEQARSGTHHTHHLEGKGGMR